MKIGFLGLGKMGSQIVTKLITNGQEVVVSDPNPAAVEAMRRNGATMASSREDLLKQLPTPIVVWLMIPADFVEEELKQWLNILPAGTILADGGNSDFRLTLKRAALAKEKGVELVDVGTSGGVLGLKNGFSMMVGGSDAAVATIKPILETMAKPSGGYHHFGPTGAGHYIKMVHNGIEYGIMQAYAEGYRLLHDGKDFADLDLTAVAKVWQAGSIINSQLNGLIESIYSSNSNLDGIEGYVAETGEGRWTLDTATTQGLSMPALAVAIEVRAASRNGDINHGTQLLAAMRNSFGGHATNKTEPKQ